MITNSFQLLKFLTFLFGYFITRPNCVFCELYAKIRFVGESATFLIFFDLSAVLDCNDKYLNHCFAQNCFKNRQFCGIRNKTWGIRNQFVEFENKFFYMCFVNLSVRIISQDKNYITGSLLRSSTKFKKA